MRVDEFDFDFAPELIAARPVHPRDASRLLVVGERIEDWAMLDLPRLLRPGDLLVANDTRVIPARLMGLRGATTVELTLHGDLGGGRWRALAKGAKKLKEGDRIDFGDDFRARVASKNAEGDVTLEFGREGGRFKAALSRYGHVPLPPYIKRADDANDRSDYQTIFAAKDGAVAAPTAGLHFTQRLLSALDAAGIGCITVTLHVGAGTFLPIKVADTSDHKMHEETGWIDAATARRINLARSGGGRIVAVGTTALRLLETAAGDDGVIEPFAGKTALFITPGYRFKAIDLLMTNFHLPRSTLFMLVSAFAGLARMKSAYAHAIAARYRFFSYGDACLLYPAARQ